MEFNGTDAHAIVSPSVEQLTLGIVAAELELEPHRAQHGAFDDDTDRPTNDEDGQEQPADAAWAAPRDRGAHTFFVLPKECAQLIC